MRVVVTGNNSAVAQKLATDIKNAGHKVTGMYRKGNDVVKAKGVEYSEYAVSPKANVIVHCYEPKQVYSPVDIDREVADRDAMEEASQALKVNPKARFIYVSSAGMYQKDEGYEPVDGLMENTQGIISNVDVAHALVETMVAREYKDYYIIRPAILYTKNGPNLFFRELERAKEMKFPTLPGAATEFSVTSDHNLSLLVNHFIDDYNMKETGIYDLSDDNPIKSKNFLTELFRVWASPTGRRSRPVFVPTKLAWSYAVSHEVKSMRKESEPQLTRTIVANTSRDCRVDISKAKALVNLEETSMDYLIDALT